MKISFESLIIVFAYILLCAIIWRKILLLRFRRNKFEDIGNYFAIITQESIGRRDLLMMLGQISKKIDPYTLLKLADKYNWSSYVISCLPKIFFVHKNRRGEIIIWEYVLKLLPKAIKYELLESYCNSEILLIKAEGIDLKLIRTIAKKFEHERHVIPFDSFESLKAVLNQSMIEIEYGSLEKSTKERIYASEFREKRIKFLFEELHNKSVPSPNNLRI